MVLAIFEERILDLRVEPYLKITFRKHIRHMELSGLKLYHQFYVNLLSQYSLAHGYIHNHED